MKKVVILSGGMDSAVILAQVVKTFGNHEVKTLSFNYGSKHNDREFICAKALSKYYGVENIRIDLPFINLLFKSDLLKSGNDIPEGHYEHESMKRTVVPFRNGIMLSIAVGYAESIDADMVCIGNHAGDHAIYPDCRKNFINAFNEASIEGTFKGIKIISWFCNMKKYEICKLGNELKVPFEKTYSCYKGEEIHCGRCSTCCERREAFHIAKISDPTEYKDNEYWKTICQK